MSTSSRGQSLRSILALATTVVVLASLVMAAALVSLTSILHRTTDSAAVSVESVQLAQDAEVDLLLHARAVHPVLRRELEQDIHQRHFTHHPITPSPIR